jgi:flagellar protein FlaG
METELKPTVAMDSRRMVPAASAHQSGSASGQAAVTATFSQAGKGVEGKQGSQAAVDSSSLDDAVRELNSHIQNVQRNLQFDLDDESGHTVVRVLDAETDEVIRQMPSEEVLALARHIKSMTEKGQGLFLEEKA